MTTMIDVLLMAYGGPDSLDDVPAYLNDIRGGRPTSPELIAEITENYRKIGGKSPLLELTRRQAAAVEQQLNATAEDGKQYRVHIGMLHWHPYIKDTVASMVELGVENVIALALAPHYSRMSIEKYLHKLDAALAEHINGFSYTAVTSYHTHPLLIEALAQRVKNGLATMPADTHVIFSAHSLPVRVIEEGDPYDTQLHETAALVAERAGVSPENWSFCYQSAGRTPEPWLGPQIDAYIAQLARIGHKSLLSVVIGFVSDHVEVLFDIDINAQAVAREWGVRLDRVPSLNDDPLFIAALVDVIRQQERVLA